MLIVRGILFRALLPVGLLSAAQTTAEIRLLEFGGGGGVPWAHSTAMNLMVDDGSVPGAMQPLQLDPDQSVVSRLRHWTRYRKPIDFLWRPGMPRVWRGLGDISRPGGGGANPLDYIDGSLDTYFTQLNFEGGGLEGQLYGEYYTLDLGLQIPVERFVLRIPDGNHPISGERFRPNFAFDSYELSGSSDVFQVETQERPPGFDGREAVPAYYQPLDILLARVSQNLSSDAEITFPLQYLRFLRIRLIPIETVITKYVGTQGGEIPFESPFFSKFRVLEAAQVDVSVFTLSGDRVWSGKPGRVGGGSHALQWNGRDAADQLVPPGVYLVWVEAETDAGRDARVHPVAVAY